MTLTTAHRIVLPPFVDGAVSAEFGAAIRRDRLLPIVLRASAVQTMTLSFTQLVLAARCQGVLVSVESPSDAFLAAFRSLDLEVPPLCPEESESSTDDTQSRSSTDNEEVMAKRILTIDDSKTIRQMLMLTLQEAGYDVSQANDGQEGVDALGKDTFDLVITDINMPRMDGYGVIRNMRADPRHQTTPILVLTTESESDKKNLARDLGATGWVVKPFDPGRLIETVRKVAA